MDLDRQRRDRRRERRKRENRQICLDCQLNHSHLSGHLASSDILFNFFCQEETFGRRKCLPKKKKRFFFTHTTQCVCVLENFFIFIHVHVCLCTYTTGMYEYLGRPEEGIKILDLELQAAVSHSTHLSAGNQSQVLNSKNSKLS